MSSSASAGIYYQKALFNASNKLSNADITNLKFLCGDLLPRRVLEGITSGLELFTALEDVNQLSRDNLEFLQIILDSISKGHLVEEIRRAVSGGGDDGDLESLSSDPSSLGPTHPLNLKFNTFLISLGAELPARDLKYVAYFFRSLKVTGLSVQEVQRLREPAELFDILKREKVISPTKVERLREVMEAIGRIDLRDKVVQYMESVAVEVGGGGGLHGGVRDIVLDSNSDSMSSDFSYDDREFSRAPGGRTQQQLTTMNQGHTLHQPKTGVRDYPLPQSEEDMPKPNQRHLVVPGQTHQGMGVPVEESQPPGVQHAEHMSQAVGGENTAKMVGMISGNSVNMSARGSRAPHEQARTRTQQLQFGLNKAHEKIQVLENQLAHERVHVAEQRHRDKEALEQVLARKNAEISNLLQTAALLEGQLQSGDEGELYPMNSVPPHGVAIVIVNNTFEPNPHDTTLPPLQPRRGAHRDAELFIETFSFLNYDVECHHNLTSEKMHQVIDEVAGRNHTAYDSFVLCVSTHGTDELIYGSDSIGVKRAELIQTIKRCKTLLGKPKMFFLQACRNRPSPAIEGVAQREKQKTESMTVYQPDALPQDADVFIANATTVNASSYRDPSAGSWFVTTIRSVFIRNGPHLNLTALMQEVNREVCVTRGTLEEHNTPVQQCAEITSSFRYGLRFKCST